MKTKFRNSSAFISYSFLSVLFGASATIFLVWSGMFVWKIAGGKVLPVWFDLTAKLKYAVPSYYSNFQAGTYTISEFTGNVNIWRPSFIVSILGNMIPVILWGSMCYGVFLLRKILQNVYQGKHFAEDNVNNMKIIGWMVIIVPHVMGVLRNFVIGSIPAGTFINGMMIKRFVSGPIQFFSFVLIPEVIVVGLIVFVFAEVFKEGSIIKQENDLTV
jgi:hypothetical protein